MPAGSLNWLPVLPEMPASPRAECLVVGYGLAGACLTEALLNEGWKVTVIDDNKAFSTRVAAGIVNPLVFRYLTMSWKAEELLPFARNYYQSLGEKLSVNLLHEALVLRVLAGNEAALWDEKRKLPQLLPWMDPADCPNGYLEGIDAPLGFAAVTNSFWVDTGLFLSSMYARHKPECNWLAGEFDAKNLKSESGKLVYDGIKSHRVIFCEGHRAVSNPYFSYVPFRPVKGELLTLHIPGLGEDFIYNKDVFILPIGNQLFKLGSTYVWDDLSPLPTENARNQLLSKLEVFMKLPYKVVDHVTGVRPAIADRRPVLGLHPGDSRMAIFNGLGAKGVMLAPFFASQLATFLSGKGIISPEVDVVRFAKQSLTPQIS